MVIKITLPVIFASGAALDLSWGPLGVSCGPLSHFLRPFWGLLGISWGLLGDLLGASWALLGVPWAILDGIVALGASWGSWGHPGNFLGNYSGLLGLLEAS